MLYFVSCVYYYCRRRVCVCVLPGSFRWMGDFYFKIETEVSSLTQRYWPEKLHKQSLTMRSKHKHHIQLLGNDAHE